MADIVETIANDGSTEYTIGFGGINQIASNNHSYDNVIINQPTSFGIIFEQFYKYFFLVWPPQQHELWVLAGYFVADFKF